jgi:hypothetical protein
MFVVFEKLKGRTHPDADNDPLHSGVHLSDAQYVSGWIVVAGSD